MEHTKAGNRIVSLALSIVMLLAMGVYLPGPVAVQAADVEIIDVYALRTGDHGPGWYFELSSMTLFLRQPGSYLLTGTNPTGTSRYLNVEVTASDVEVTLRGCDFNAAYPLRCGGNRVTLILEGTNKLIATSVLGGVWVADGAELTIAGSGSLYAESGPNGPGIRGHSNSVITITGDANVTAQGGSGAAGIGGGQEDDGGVVNISGNAHVIAQGGTGAAGIGGGQEDDGGVANISGNAHVIARGGQGAAGIGGGKEGDGGVVNISDNALVEAYGDNAPGIGSGNTGSPSGGRVTITGGHVTAGSNGSLSMPAIGSLPSVVNQGTLHVSGGAYLELNSNNCSLLVDRSDGSLEIGSCTIADNAPGANLSGSYYWLRVEDGTIVSPTLPSFWLTDTAGRQIIPSHTPMTIQFAPGTVPGCSRNISYATNPLNPDEVIFNMPDGDAWITAINRVKPPSVRPDTLTLDLDSSPTGTVTLDLGVDSGDGISPAATGATAVSSDPVVASVDAGPHTGEVTITGQKRGDATVTFTFDDTDGTAIDVLVTVTEDLGPEPGAHQVTVRADPAEGGSPYATPTDATPTQIVEVEARANKGWKFTGWSASPRVDFADAAGENTTFEMPDSAVTITASYTKSDDGGGPEPPNPPGPGYPDGGGTSSASGSRSRSSGSRSSSATTQPKTQLPASASSWDGRTLTIDDDRVGVLGLTNVLWDGVGTEAYKAYQGSVIIRFDQDFIAAQAPGEHTVRVEFLNHIAETAITVDGTGQGSAGTGDSLPANNNYNPATGGYPTAGTGTAGHPNTGDGRSVWSTLAYGCIGGAALVIGEKLKIVS